MAYDKKVSGLKKEIEEKKNMLSKEQRLKEQKDAALKSKMEEIIKRNQDYNELAEKYLGLLKLIFH